MAFLLMASACPARADDMIMMLPVLAAPFLVVGLVLAIALWIMARKTKVRTGILTTILIVGTLLSGIPGAIGALVSIKYVSPSSAVIAIPYLIAFLVYVAVVALAFWAIMRRKDGRSAANIATEATKNGPNQAFEGMPRKLDNLKADVGQK